MIDLHIHILPGIDDGSDSMSESLLMAEEAVNSGVKEMIVTPHSHQVGRYENYYDEKLKAIFHEFQEALIENHIPLKIYLGMEIYALEDLKEKIIEGQVIGLNHTDYYLIEFGFHDDPYYMESILNDVLSIGKIPIIAHPERYICVQQNREFIYQWIDMGCLLQVNKGSLLGRFGRRVRHTAIKLLEQNLVTFIASDAHGSTYRTPHMEDIQDFLELYFGIDIANDLLYNNAKKILENKRL